MKNTILRHISVALSVAFFVTAFPYQNIVFADSEPLVAYDVDFENYTKDQNWVTNTGELGNMPDGWQFDGLNGGKSNVASDNIVMVVDDPASDGTHGNVLKISPSQTGKNVILHKKFVDADGKTIGAVSHQTGRKLYIKQSVYIKSTETSYFKNVDNDWYSSFLYVDSQSNSRAYQKASGGSNAYLRLNSSKDFDGSSEIGTSGIASSAPVNEWFDVEFVINTDTASSDGSNVNMTFDAYINGEKVTENKSINAMQDQWNNLAEKFYGISFAPCAYISSSNDTAPEIYIDDISAEYLGDTQCISQVVFAEGDKNGGKFNIEFSNKLSRSSFNQSLFTVEGAKGGFNSVILNDDLKTVTFSYGTSSFEPNRKYTISYDTGLSDFIGREVPAFSVDFTTNDFEPVTYDEFEVSGYSTDGSSAKFEFSNKIKSETVKNAFCVEGVADAISNVNIINDNTVLIEFDLSKLDSETTYTVKISGIEDEFGQILTNYSNTFTTPAMEKIVYNDDFSKYEKNKNWVGVNDDGDGKSLAPTGWFVNAVNSGKYSSKNIVEIVDDPTGSSMGNVLMIKPTNTGRNVTVVRAFEKGGKTSSAYAHDKTKNLYIRQKLYIDNVTASHFISSEDWYGSFVHIPYGMNNTGRHLSFAYITRNGATGISENTISVKDAKNVVNNVPVGRWFDVEYIIYTNADNVTNYDVWVDGKMMNSIELAGTVKTDQWSNFNNNFYGVAFSPVAWASDKNRSLDEPIMYVADMYASYVSPYKLSVNVQSKDGTVSDDFSSVKPDDKVLLTFDEPISDEMVKYLYKNIDQIKVSDTNGIDISDDVTIEVFNDRIQISDKNGFIYGSKYKISVPALNIYNAGKQRFKGADVEFSTRKAKNEYISGYTLSTENIEDASAFTVTADIDGNPDYVLLVAYKADGTQEIYKSAISNGKVLFNVRTPAKFIKIYLIGKDGKLSQSNVIIDPNGNAKSKPKINKDASEAIAFTSDNVNSIVRIEGGLTTSGNNQYGIAFLFEEDKAQFSDYDTSDAVAVENIEIDSDGKFASEFFMNNKSGVYYIWAITENDVRRFAVDYISFDSIAEKIKKLSITDKTHSDYIPDEKIFDSIRAYATNVGVNPDGNFKSERIRKLLEYRISENRNLFSVSDNMQVVNEFNKIVNSVVKEDEFLTALENPLNKAQIEYLLRNNTEYTNIDFSSTPANLDDVLNAFIGKTFANGDEVGNLFRSVAKYTAQGSGSSGGSSSGKRSGSGSFGTNIPANVVPQPDVSVFADLNGFEWAQEAIYSLKNKKVISGYGNNEFAPGNSVTRAEFIKMIVLALSAYNDDANCDFKDVDKDNWYYKYIASALSEGFVNGYEDGTYKPNNNISRCDMAVMIYNAAGGENTFGPGDSDELFEDNQEIAEYAVAAVNSMKKAGIINGKDGNKFSPNENASRAEAAVIIHRMLSYVASVKGE